MHVLGAVHSAGARDGSSCQTLYVPKAAAAPDGTRNGSSACPDTWCFVLAVTENHTGPRWCPYTQQRHPGCVASTARLARTAGSASRRVWKGRSLVSVRLAALCVSVCPRQLSLSRIVLMSSGRVSCCFLQRLAVGLCGSTAWHGMPWPPRQPGERGQAQQGAVSGMLDACVLFRSVLLRARGLRCMRVVPATALACLRQSCSLRREVLAGLACCRPQ